MIRERTRAGLDAARARGRVGGRPRALNENDLDVAKTLLAVTTRKHRDFQPTLADNIRGLGPRLFANEPTLPANSPQTSAWAHIN